MRRTVRRPRRWVLPLIAGLLLALAALQYVWLGRLSEAERERLAASSAAAADRFTEDVDREITRAFFFFIPPPRSSSSEWERLLTRRLTEWRDTAPYPQIVRDLYLVERTDEEIDLVVHWTREGELTRSPDWPPELDRLRQAMRTMPNRRARFPYPVIGSPIPALVIRARPTRGPLPFAQPPDVPSPLPRRSEARREASYVIVLLDQEFIASEWLPELTERYFSSHGMHGFEVVVAAGEELETIVYRSSDSLNTDQIQRADGRRPLLRLRPFRELRSLPVELRESLQQFFGADPRSRFARSRGGQRRGWPPRLSWPEQAQAGPWTFVWIHRAGSIEAAIRHARWRNVSLSLGILLLLGVTLWLMVRWARRAELLADQQMTFVAGVTHELHTPLTALGTAGQNLADGVVSGEDQVRRYGTMIVKEAGRLSRMVSQVLE
ncbi:MAG: hypothetical protein JSV80_17445, partial [Acidobacteriota bacterium]